MRSLPLAHSPGGVYYQYIFFPLSKVKKTPEGQGALATARARPRGAYIINTFFSTFRGKCTIFSKHIQELQSRSKRKGRSSHLDLPSFTLLVPIMTKYLKDCDLSEIFPHLIDYAVLSINSS